MLICRNGMIRWVVCVAATSGKVLVVSLLSLETRYRDFDLFGIVMLRLVAISFIVERNVVIFAVAAELTTVCVVINIVVVIGIAPLLRLLMLLRLLVHLHARIRTHLLYFDIVVRCNADYCDK